MHESNQKLRVELNRYQSYVQHHSVMWRKRDDGTEDGPFCPVCVAERVDMRLSLKPHVDQTQLHWHLYCTKAHVNAGSVRDLSRSKEQSYAIPKEIVPVDYFYVKPFVASDALSG